MSFGALIVDDDEDIRRLIEMTIEGANRGLSVRGRVASGREAIEQLARRSAAPDA